MPIDYNLWREIGRQYARDRQQARQTVATPEPEEPGFWENLRNKALVPLEVGRAGLGYWAGRLDPEAYQRALQANIAADPEEATTLGEKLYQAPSAGQTLVESLLPGEQESALGRIAKTTGTLVGEIATDPLSAVPMGGGVRAAKLLGKAATKGGKLARLGGKPVGAGRLAGTVATKTVASPLAAAAVYGPDIARAAGASGGEAIEQFQQGNTARALEAAAQTVIVGGLGGALGYGTYKGLKGSVAEAKSPRKAIQDAGESPEDKASIGESLVVTTKMEEGLQELKFPKGLEPNPYANVPYANEILRQRIPYDPTSHGVPVGVEPPVARDVPDQPALVEPSPEAPGEAVKTPEQPTGDQVLADPTETLKGRVKTTQEGAEELRTDISDAEAKGLRPSKALPEPETVEPPAPKATEEPSGPELIDLPDDPLARSSEDYKRAFGETQGRIDAEQLDEAVAALTKPEKQSKESLKGRLDSLRSHFKRQREAGLFDPSSAPPQGGSIAARTLAVMADGRRRTAEEVAEILGAKPRSVYDALEHFKTNKRFGELFVARDKGTGDRLTNIYQIADKEGQLDKSQAFYQIEPKAVWRLPEKEATVKVSSAAEIAAAAKVGIPKGLSKMQKMLQAKDPEGFARTQAAQQKVTPVPRLEGITDTSAVIQKLESQIKELKETAEVRPKVAATDYLKGESGRASSDMAISDLLKEIDRLSAAGADDLTSQIRLETYLDVARKRLGKEREAGRLTVDTKPLTSPARQLAHVRSVMLDGRWRTSKEISSFTGIKPKSVTAQIARLKEEGKRKDRPIVETQRVGGELKYRVGGRQFYQVEKGAPVTKTDPLTPESIKSFLESEFPGLKITSEGTGAARQNRVLFPNKTSVVITQTGVLRPDKEAYKRIHGEYPKGDVRLKGETKEIGLNQLITIARSGDFETIRHEFAGHMPILRGLLTPKELDDIYDYYGKNIDRSKSNWEDLIQENFADAVGKGVLPKVALNALQRVWQFFKRLVKGLSLEERVRTTQQAIPQRIVEAQKGAEAGQGKVPPGTARPIPPEGDTTASRLPETVLTPIEGPAIERGTLGRITDIDAKPGGKPDVSVNINRLFEMQEDLKKEGIDLSDEHIQGFVNASKALQPTLDRAEVQPMARGALQAAARDAYQGMSDKQIEKALTARGWTAEDVAYWSAVENRMRIDWMIKEDANLRSHSEETESAMMKAQGLMQAMGHFIGNRKTQTARALKAWHYASGIAGTPEGKIGFQIYHKNKARNRYLNLLKEQGLAEDKIKKLAGIPDPKDFMEGFDNAFKPGFLDWLIEARTGGMLTGAGTQAVNISSNAALGALSAIRRVIVEPQVDRTAAKFENRDRRRTTRGEVKALFAGYRYGLFGSKGTTEGVYHRGALSQLFSDLKRIATLQDIDRDVKTVDPSRAIGKEHDVRRPHIIGAKTDSPIVTKVGGKLIRSGGQSLEAFDSFFKSISASQEIFRRAFLHERFTLRAETNKAALDQMHDTVNAIYKFHKKRTPIPEIPKDKFGKELEGKVLAEWRKIEEAKIEDSWQSKILKKVARVAREDTLQAELGPHAKKLQVFIDSHKLIRLTVAPFFRTPINIMKESLKHTPVGFYTAIQKKLKARDPKLGPIASADLDERAMEDLSKALIGGAVGGAVAWFVAEHSDTDSKMQITGAGPKDFRLNKLWRDAGNQAYSIRVGDRFYDYSRIEPLSSTIGIAADLVEAQKREDIGLLEIEKLSKAMVATMTENLLRKTVYMSLEGLFDTLHEPDRNLNRYMETYFASFIPTAIKATARATDPVIRKKESFFSSFDWLTASIPGLSTTLPARRTSAGEELRREVPFSPVYSTIRKKGPTADLQREMLRINYRGPIVATKMQIGEVKVPIPPEDMTRLYELRRATLEELGKRLLSDPTYQRASDAKKKAIMSKAIATREKGLKRQIRGRLMRDQRRLQ